MENEGKHRFAFLRVICLPVGTINTDTFETQAMETFGGNRKQILLWWNRCSRWSAEYGQSSRRQHFLTATSFFYLTNNETRYLRAFSKTLRKFEKNKVSLLRHLCVSFNRSINFFGEMVPYRSEPDPVRGPLLLENLSKSSSDLQTDHVEMTRSKCFMH